MTIKDKIKEELIKNHFLMYNQIQIMHQNIEYFLHRKSASEYKTLGIFDVNKIPDKVYYYKKEIYPHNSFYGLEKTLREYAGWHKTVNAYIEHGIADEKDVDEKEFYQYNKPAFITFGDMRESAIAKKINTKVIKIGPYIHYAQPWYTAEEEKSIKKRYGRIMTVFPMHNIEGGQSFYNIENFCNEINQCKKELKIDTIFLCGYWYDIICGNLEPYKQYDFVWVSAGHAMDQNFLSRLKSIIRLSDYTMSNRFGTHVGYSLALNIPHRIYEQKVIDKFNGNVIEGSYFERTSCIFDDFAKFYTSEQKDVAEYIFGFSKVLSPVELKEALEKL